jgi:hypothetical protein
MGPPRYLSYINFADESTCAGDEKQSVHKVKHVMVRDYALGRSFDMSLGREYSQTVGKGRAFRIALLNDTEIPQSANHRRHFGAWLVNQSACQFIV